MKYHVNPEGNVHPCNALLNCPFGSEEVHFEDQASARSWYERQQVLNTFERRRITKAQGEALHSYQGGLYETVNEALRFDEELDEKGESIITHLDALMNSGNEFVGESVYRVVASGPGYGYLRRKMNPGVRFQEYGYLSTTESDEFVHDCLDHGLNDGDINTIIAIDVNPDRRCIRPTRYTQGYDNEEEVLFERGIEFEVVEDSLGESDTRFIHLKML